MSSTTVLNHSDEIASASYTKHAFMRSMSAQLAVRLDVHRLVWLQANEELVTWKSWKMLVTTLNGMRDRVFC